MTRNSKLETRNCRQALTLDFGLWTLDFGLRALPDGRASAWLALFLQTRGPVQHHGERSRGGICGRDGHEKTLAVGSDDVIIPQANLNLANARFKKRLRHSNLEAVRLALHFDGHQFSVRGQIEDFFIVAAPVRFDATARRDRPPAARGGKALHVNL